MLTELQGFDPFVSKSSLDFGIEKNKHNTNGKQEIVN